MRKYCSQKWFTLRKGGQSELFLAYSHCVQDTIPWELQVAKVGLIT